MTTNSTIRKLQKENELLKKQIKEMKKEIRAHSKYKETLTALQESEDRFKQLSDLAYEGIIIHDNGIVIDVNLAIEKISGYLREEIIGANMFDLFVPEKYQALVHENIIKNRTLPYKIEAKHKNGHFIPIEIESRNITIGNKKTRVTAIRDLSEKVKTMKELEDSREKYKKASELFRLLADTTPDMIWAKDMEGNFTFVNKAICENLINAKDTEEPIGKHVMFFVNRERAAHPDNKEWFTFGEECVDSDAITIKNRKTSRFIEYGNVFGKNLILDVYKAPLWNDKSEMIGTVGSARDITKQQEAEEKLKRSEERYRMLFENAPDPIVIHNGKTILDVNIATVKSLGVKSKNDLIGKDLLPYIHPDDLAMSRKRMKKMLDNFNPLESKEMRIITSAGKEITTIATPTPIHFNGEVAFMVTYHDITNRKKAEEIIANKEQQLNTIIESAFDAIYLIDYYTTQIILANQQAANQTGFTTEELLTLTISDINPAFNDDRFRNDLRLKIINETLVTVEMTNKHKKGHTFPAEVRTSMINYNGRKTLLAFVRDITERKKAEKALMESEERFKKLSDITFEGILIHEKGVAIDMNNALPKMFGYKKEELMGKNLIQLLVSKKYHPIIAGHMKEEYAHSYRVIGIRKDGTPFPLELEAKTVNYKNKTTIRVAALRDISYRVKNERDLQKAYEELYEQKEKLEELNDKLKKSIEHTNKINKELEIAKKRAEESDRLKSAFLANMSHEIRTPMNGILGFTTLLKNLNISPQERLTYLDIIEKSGSRLVNIINNLIDISKIESGQMTVSKADCNITKELKELYAFFKLECRQKRLELIYSNISDEPLIVNTDQDKFTAIVTNLIKNAIKYTKRGSIKFGYNVKNDNIEFFVKDTGIGIPKERQKAIFERFIQADIEDRQAYEGAGLGLAISMAYVKMLGGKIGVESIEGEGSTFYFTLPYTPPAKKEPLEKSKKPVASSHNKIPKLNILIVDDEPYADELLTIIVKKFADNLYHAKTGEEAIDIFKKHPNIDLILMDMKMQNINGYQASKEIRKLSDKVIIIAQTAMALSGEREKALESGCNDYISKPIIKKVLLEKISNFF